MFPNGSAGHNKPRYVYYRCPKRIAHGPDACTHRKHYRAEKVETAAWNVVARLLTDPAKVRVAVDEMIDRERQASKSDPDRQACALREQLAEAGRKRSRYQEMAAEGLIDFDELRAKLTTLEETCRTAQRELEALQSRKEQLADLEHDRDALLERYASLVPEALDALEAEERHRLYKMLRMKVITSTEGVLEMSGMLTGNVGEFGEWETTSMRTSSWRSMGSGRQRRA
jgi:chromosome segregation ATPase